MSPGEYALTLAGQGWTVAAISRELGRPYSTVYDWVAQGKTIKPESVRCVCGADIPQPLYGRTRVWCSLRCKRRHEARLPCPDCGAPRMRYRERCAACAGRVRRHPRREQAETLLRSGVRQSVVARLCGVPDETVARWRRELGIPAVRGWTGADRVGNERLRAVFLRSGLAPGEVARRCGWLRSGGVRAGRADDTRVRTVLGLRSVQDGRGDVSRRRTLRCEEALLICEALHVDPREIGL